MRYYPPGIFLEGLVKSMKTTSEESWSANTDLKLGYPN
jgi:hypothetical protein